jgi:hypothetical protein
MPNQALAVDDGVPSPVRIAGAWPATTEAQRSPKDAENWLRALAVRVW